MNNRSASEISESRSGSGDGLVVLVTGQLAEPALRRVADQIAANSAIRPHVVVMKITVAALMTVDWLRGKLQVPERTARVVLPGWCRGDVKALSEDLNGVPVERGPKDLRDLPEYFKQPASAVPYGDYDIEILAEINHANRLTREALTAEAQKLQAEGADVVDLGATPGEQWPDLAGAVRELKQLGLRLSIDSFDPAEVEQATSAGAELVLSVNETNRHLAKDWGVEVVVLPDGHQGPDWLRSLETTLEILDRDSVRYRIDPILEPIGFGFARSLHRYLLARDRFPDVPMMMGIGNLTELTEVDSAGVNAMLIGFCQELQISSVLTTQVINWARSSVKEVDVARRLMKYAVDQQVLPKHRDGRLVMLRDAKVSSLDSQQLRELHEAIRDPNFRLFASDGVLTAMNAHLFVQDADAFRLFEQLGVTDASHAFYLGWELMKAALAVQLGKQYVQDEALNWGLLTVPEVRHRDRKRAEREGEGPDDS